MEPDSATKRSHSSLTVLITTYTEVGYGTICNLNIIYYSHRPESII